MYINVKIEMVLEMISTLENSIDNKLCKMLNDLKLNNKKYKAHVNLEVPIWKNS